MTTQTAKNPEDVLRSILDTVEIPEKDVYMRRFGVNFRIKAIDNREIGRIRELATYPTKGGGSQIDNDKFGLLIIEKGCVVPNWTDAQITDKFGPTPADAIQKRLLPGEMAALSGEILTVSGFGNDDEAIDEIKN